MTKQNDGIQVTVNSDEEELDYDDILLPDGEFDDEMGSIADEANFDNPSDVHVDQVDTENGNLSHLSTDVGIILGVTSSSMNDEELVMSNPHLKKLFNKMLDDRIKKAAGEKGESSSSRLLSSMTPPENTKRGKDLIKSPSDTTVYAPTLQKVNPRFQNVENIEMGVNTKDCLCNVTSGSLLSRLAKEIDRTKKTDKSEDQIMQKISNFVDQLHLEQEGKEVEDNEQQQDVVAPASQLRSAVSAPGYEEVKRHSEQAVIEAEKFRATIETTLKGRSLQLPQFLSLTIDRLGDEQLPVVRPQIGLGGISDYDFFHLTCHINQSLQHEIENGQFVDLDKLLPKEKGLGEQQYSNETKLEWVQRDGNTYLVPASKSSKINCFHRWEQAFRMYATIYCSKHPNWSREIWQYISVINTASMAYNWENVYHYNIVF